MIAKINFNKIMKIVVRPDQLSFKYLYFVLTTGQDLVLGDPVCL